MHLWVTFAERSGIIEISNTKKGMMPSSGARGGGSWVTAVCPLPPETPVDLLIASRARIKFELQESCSNSMDRT